jgi:hypothetical protein
MPLIYFSLRVLEKRLSRGVYLPIFLSIGDQSAKTIRLIFLWPSVISASFTGIKSCANGIGFALLPSQPKAL